jgi:hypothetical protein
MSDKYALYMTKYYLVGIKWSRPKIRSIEKCRDVVLTSWSGLSF